MCLGVFDLILSRFATKAIFQRKQGGLNDRTNLKSLALGVCLAGLGIGLGYFLLWLPAEARMQSLNTEKEYWQATPDMTVAVTYDIPVLEELPEVIEFCRQAFVSEGAGVSALNVERFAGQTEKAASDRLDYALLRVHINGSWTEIERALTKLEEAPGYAIQVEEVILTSSGGEGLLRIYFLDKK